MKIELDGIPLSTTVTGKMGQQQEVRSIRKITTADRRNVLAYDIPGMEGSTFQNLGRSAVLITFDGLIIGKSARAVLETIRSKYKSGLPLPFNSDITGATDVTKVIVQELTISESTELMYHFEYTIVLKEFKEPPPEPTTPPPQDEEAGQWAEETAQDALDSKNKVKGSVMDAGGQPVSGKEVVIANDGGEYVVTTDENGDYYVEDLPPGEYAVKVNDPAYEGQTRYIDVGGADSSGPVGEAKVGDEVRQANTEDDSELRQIEAEVEDIAQEIGQIEAEMAGKAAQTLIDDLLKSDIERLMGRADKLYDMLSNPEKKLDRIKKFVERVSKVRNRITDLKARVRNTIKAKLRQKLEEIEEYLLGTGDGGGDEKGPLSDDGEGTAGTQVSQGDGGSFGSGMGGGEKGNLKDSGGGSAGYQTEDDHHQGYSGGDGEKGDLKDDSGGSAGGEADEDRVPPTGGA